MNPYQTRSTEGLSGVEQTLALYDGIIRFLYRAIDAVERGDVNGRRAAVKRALDIVIHLQATLRTDVGGKPAEALAEFYLAVFALILQGSQRASAEKFLHAIECVKNVRGAWRQILNDPAAMEAAAIASGPPQAVPNPYAGAHGSESAGWTA